MWSTVCRMRFAPLPLVAAAAALLASSASLWAADAPNHEKGPTPLHISHGEKLEIADFAVTGKTTIFDFYSEYCPPCRAIAPAMDKLHATHPELAVVKIDINRPGHKGIDWSSPVAQQYELRSVPHFTVVGPDGKSQADGDEAYNKVLALIEADEKK